MKAVNQSFKDKKGRKECYKKQANLSQYRYCFIRDQFHKMTRLMINYCILNNIGTIVCGYNTRWKDSTDMGKINNQKFVHVPHRLFLKTLKYKCDLVGIVLICHEESYTSKCDGLALESVKKHKKYLGKRVHRGLFQSSLGKLINADINGALNTLRKVIGDGSFIKDLIDSVVLFNPVKIRFTNLVGGQTLSNLLVGC
jgi:putative transposase